MPAHLAYSFTYNRSRTDTRSGGKRIGGLAETSQTGGLPTAVTLINLGSLEGALESMLSDGTDNFRPRVLGKRAGLLGLYFNPVSSVNFLGITSQNTRKFYTAPGF